jgi:NitT/TauT family transport system permease protein
MSRLRLNLGGVHDDRIAVSAEDSLPKRGRLIRQVRSHSLSVNVLATQLAIVAVFLLLWQFLPQISAVRHSGHIFNPLFISSPSSIARLLYELLIGSETSRGYVWEYIGHTLAASAIGLAIGLVVGGLAGLVIGSNRLLGRVFRPFAVVMNAVPRIAIIPVIIAVLGTNFASSVVNSLTVVCFITFFNAFEGAVTVPPHFVQNANVLGGKRLAVMRHVQFPYVLGWTLASLPLAATYSLLAVVTGELLSGYPGLGLLLSQAQGTFDVTLTFAVVVILAVLGLSLVGLAELVKRRTLHWWGR